MTLTKEKGSLQAAQAIASSIKTLLGPFKSTKCCINGDDDRDAIICSNTAKILQYLQVEHPVGYIINDACQAMHKIHGCGCTTLVCMIGFWSKSALTLQHEGVPVSIICQLFNEAVWRCIQMLEEIAVPIQEALDRCEINVKSSNIDTPQEDPTSTSSVPSLCLFEKVWKSSDEIETNTTDTDHGAWLTSNSSVVFSLDESNTRKMKYGKRSVTQKLAAKITDSKKPQNDRELTALYGHYSINEEKCLSESSNLQDEEVKDEFDSCFEGQSVTIQTCSKALRRKEAESVCRSLISNKEVDLNKRSLNTSRKQKSKTFCNNSDLAMLDHMLKDLSFSGQKLSKLTSTVNNVSEILKSCHNLSIDSPKTTLAKDTNQTLEDPVFQTNSFLVNVTRQNLERLGKMLSHGKDKEMILAVEVLFNQISSEEKKNNLKAFKVDQNTINIERIIGPTSDHSQVVTGLLLRQKSQLTGPLKRGAVHVAIVTGDVTEEFRHVGFRDSFQTKRTFNEQSYKNLYTNNTSWLQRILNVLVTLNIGVLVARGNIDKDLEESCQALSIQTFSSISSRKVQILSHSLSVTAVVYLLDLRESHIGRPVFLRHWNGPHPGMNKEEDYFVVLEQADNSLWQCGNTSCGNAAACEEDIGLLQTVLLCGQSEHFLMDSELTFWNCIFRLRNTINCDLVLPGSGRTELACVKKLRNLSGRQPSVIGLSGKENPEFHKTKSKKCLSWLKASLPSYHTAVYTTLADGLVDFVINVLLNSGHLMNYDQAHTTVQQTLNEHNQSLPDPWLVVDDFTAKKNAWCKAVAIVCVMLQSDMTVVTGTLNQ